MFTHDAISSLNHLEMAIYHYAVRHPDTVSYMTIRELAECAGVSTTTVLRFCRKLGCDGYAEFRVHFRLWIEGGNTSPDNFGAGEIIHFFNAVNNNEFECRLDAAASVIRDAKRVIFIGTGTSGAIAKYGARFFSNVGKFSNHIDDPWFPVTQDLTQDALAIILSVSGETPEILQFASQFSLHRCTLLSITSHAGSSLAKLSDLNISWHIPQTRIQGKYDITTQIPVVYILEALGRRLVKNTA